MKKNVEKKIRKGGLVSEMYDNTEVCGMDEDIDRW